MKKLITAALAFTLMLALSCALADIIWTPGDAFFSAHYHECKEVDFEYEASQFTYFYDQPNGKRTGEITEGRTVKLSHIWYQEGEPTWGIVYWHGVTWVDLSAFRRLYDEHIFVSEHIHEIYNVRGKLLLNKGVARIEWGTAKPENPRFTVRDEYRCPYLMVMWKFPGSETILRYERWEQDHDGPRLDFDQVYIDREGNPWLHLTGYYRGRLDCWVNLVHPASEEPHFRTRRYADADVNAEADNDDPVIPAGVIDPSGTDGGNPPPLLPILSVAFALLLTAASLFLIRRKRSSPEAAGQPDTL